MKNLFLILSTCLILLLSGCSGKTFEDIEYLDVSEKQLLSDAKEKLVGGNYKQAIKMYSSFDIQYPLSKDYKSTLLYQLYSMYMDEQYEQVQVFADRILTMYPKSNSLAYIHYLKALSYIKNGTTWLDSLFTVDWAARDLSGFKLAFEEFKTVVKINPNNKYGLSAIKYMRFIRNTLAKSSVETARYYFNKELYIASSNYAWEAILNYPQSSSISDALIILKESSEKLGTNLRTKEIDNIIKENP